MKFLETFLSRFLGTVNFLMFVLIEVDVMFEMKGCGRK